MTRPVKKSSLAVTNADKYRCHGPNCDLPADINDAVWWTPYGSTCSEVCAWDLVKERRG